MDKQIEGRVTRSDQEPQECEVSTVRQITVVELKRLMESKTLYELVDVRTEGERAIATIEGFRLLDQTYHDELIEGDRETPVSYTHLTLPTIYSV